MSICSYRYDDLFRWQFEFDEISANVYEVVGRNELGRKVSAKGLDVDQMVVQCCQGRVIID